MLALAAGIVVIAVFGGTSLAVASQSPAGCNENDFILQVKQNPGPLFTVGQTITYSVRTGNTDPVQPGCDIDGVTVTFTTPDGVVHTLQTGGTYPFTTAVTQVGPDVPYVVDLNDAVAGPCGNVTQCPVIVVTAKATGNLHDDPVQDDPFTVIKQLSGAVRSPFPDHFICYQLTRKPPNAGSVSVVDQFGGFTASATQAHQLCNPANKNDEDPNIINDPNHLVMYDANSTGNPASGHVIKSTNQFGTQKMTLSTVQMVAAQSAKSLTAVPPPLVSPGDNFVCYSVKNAGSFTKIRGVKVQDQFGTLHVDLVGIREFCDPAVLKGTGTGADTHPGHLTCFKSQLPSGTKFNPPPKVFVKNMFQGNQIFPDGHVDMLCVPSTKEVVS